MVSQLMCSKLLNRQKKHFGHKDWNELCKHFDFDKKEKLFCEYCGEELLEESPYPYQKVVSFDHRIPLFQNINGNKYENIAIACVRCNIVKGTMEAETFKKFLELIGTQPEWKEKILQEMFWGRFKNKLKREEETKELMKNSGELFRYV